MKLSNKLDAKRGDVIDVRSSVSGGSYGHVVVTDPRAADRRGCVEGGHECRDATPAEVKAAQASGQVRVVYE